MSELKDKLEELFELLARLNDEIFAKQYIRGRDGGVLSMAAIAEELRNEKLGPNGLPNQWLRHYLTALKAEADELEQEVLWKWWSKDRLDLQNIRVEIVDLMHFLASMALVAGLDADEFHRLYTQKHAVNRQRQARGYSRANKDESDNRGVV